MTSKYAIVLAVSLLINDVNLVFNENVLKSKFFTSNLVFLLSAGLIVRQFDVLPSYLWTKYSIVCILLELPVTIIVLEASLYYIWRFIEDYIVLHSDDILVHLSENKGLNWLVCHMCCGRNNCPDIFALLVLRAASFGLLLAVCCLLKLRFLRNNNSKLLTEEANVQILRQSDIFESEVTAGNQLSLGSAEVAAKL